MHDTHLPVLCLPLLGIVSGAACARSGADDGLAPLPDASPIADAATPDARSDLEAPLASITGPADGATIAATSIVVTGVATDASRIASIRVGAVEATPTGPDFATWEASLTLAVGTHTLVARTEDEHGNADDAADEVTITIQPDDSTPAMGLYQGTAMVDGADLLADGSFPARLALAQSGPRLRGMLEIHQNAGFGAEAFTYYVDGTIDGDAITLTASDRVCAAVTPAALCNPVSPPQLVFGLTGTIDGDRVTFAPAVVLPGVSYPPDIAIEPPFESLTVDLVTPTHQAAHVPINTTWTGPTRGASSIVYAHMPMLGDNEMRISGADHAMERFDNDTVGNVVPSFPDLILAGSFRWDPFTERFWFQESASSTLSRYLWVGRKRGNTLTGLIVWDQPSGGHYHPDATPVDIFETALPAMVAVFVFTADTIEEPR